MKTQMHDYMQNIIEAIKFYTNKLLRKSVANWEQNDSEALDYVKGRTHYVGEEAYTIYESDSITYDSGDLEDLFSEPLIEGNKYTVICNGVTYECETGTLDDGESVYITLGNQALFKNDSIEKIESDEPFLICYSDGWNFTNFSADGTYSLKIIGYTEIIHPLDPKYIPDSIARVSDVESALSDSSTTLNEQLDSLRTEITEDLEEKVNVFQGTENTDTMLTVDEEGYVTLTPIATEEDTLNMLTEMELINPMTDESGALLTDENGAVYIL